MGKCKEKPRYNVISVRVDDEIMKQIDTHKGTASRGDFYREAVEEKLARQTLIDCLEFDCSSASKDFKDFVNAVLDRIE